MKKYSDLTDNQKQDLQATLRTLSKVANAYSVFDQEYQAAIKKAGQDNSHTYVRNNFNQIFTIAKDYGIGNGLMSFDSVQNQLNNIANTIKRLAIYPNAILHQVIDDITTVATDFGGSYDQWLDSINMVVQDGHCLKNDVDEIQTSFQMK